MSYLSNLYSSKSIYKKFREDIVELKMQLSDCHESFLEVPRSLKENCNINHFLKQSDQLKDEEDNIQVQIDLLTSTIIPAIDRELSSISTKIQAEERRIELARQEALKKQKEEEQKKKESENEIIKPKNSQNTVKQMLN